MSEMQAYRLRADGLPSDEPPEGATCSTCAHFDAPPEWMTGTNMDCGVCKLNSLSYGCEARRDGFGRVVRKVPAPECDPEWVYAADEACVDWRGR